jgi:signal transduction histidine kinase
VADGDPLSLFTLKRRLEAGGWFVEGRLSAAGLVEELDGMVCTLILANANLPGQSGLEFCKALRRKGGRELLPVILVIDSARPEDIEAAFKAGANDYLIRPIGGGELLARVQTHVDLASGIQRDLDQRARMAETDKFKTLGWLTAGVAHEINTPNNAALRNVPLLKEVWAELLEPLERIYRAEGDFRIRGFSYEDLLNEVPEILNDLYMGAQHIRKIVTDLKDYARGPDPGGRTPTDINQVILYAARLLKHDIALASDAVSFELADGLPAVLADRLKLTQVMVNVLENALQALPDRSRAVLVRSRLDGASDAKGSWLTILVRDEGVGMDERTLASAFDPFFSTKRERGGTGLGLAVAVGIVRDLGGSMEIHSSPGAGTELLIRLPAQPGASGGTA